MSLQCLLLFSTDLIQRGTNLYRESVQLPDRPGELVRVADVIAKAQGNIIRLEHNQFVSINRNAAVELTITMEAFGNDHKESIIAGIKKGRVYSRKTGTADCRFTNKRTENTVMSYQQSHYSLHRKVYETSTESDCEKRAKDCSRDIHTIMKSVWI